MTNAIAVQVIGTVQKQTQPDDHLSLLTLNKTLGFAPEIGDDLLVMFIASTEPAGEPEICIGRVTGVHEQAIILACDVPENAQVLSVKRLESHSQDLAHAGQFPENQRPEKVIRLNCARCGLKKCNTGHDCPSLAPYTRQVLEERLVHTSMTATADTDAAGYGIMTRLEEIISYAQNMGYQHIGIAFCISLQDEARRLDEILKRHFKVTSACCKITGIQKKELGIAYRADKEIDTSCNPAAQALILNEAKTDFNLIVGLCIGHEQIFGCYSNAPHSVFIVKDRVLGHNPIMALYSSFHRARIDKLPRR